MTQNKKEQWLKKFEEEFDYMDDSSIEKEFWNGKKGLPEGITIRQFISSLIDDIDLDWENRILEAVGEEKKQLDKNDPDNYGACYAIAGFNDCRSQILEKLKLKK